MLEIIISATKPILPKTGLAIVTSAGSKDSHHAENFLLSLSSV
jgi:hypothetical protein